MIYLDNNATTQCDPRVVDKMLPFFYEKFGNPHSRNHQFGWDAENSIEEARSKVARLMGAQPKEIIFTSGATESNNLALKGVWEFFQGKKNHIITSTIEHKCILDTTKYLAHKGVRITSVPVDKEGFLDLDDLEKSLTPDTALVSVIFVNNEIGTIQHIKKIADICRKKGVYLHTDAAQALGRIPIDVNDLDVDLMSISGHKIYGPKGIGALYVRKTNRRVRLTPQMNGGGQEMGVRSGTLATPLCVGLGEACHIAQETMSEESQRIQHLTHQLYHGITNQLSHVYVNGSMAHRVPGNLNMSFDCVEGEGLMMAIKNLAVSSGSACTSSSLEPSYVLKALGIPDDLSHTSLRFGIGRFTTEDEVNQAVHDIVSAVNKLRDLSPLWEMKQEGIDISTIQWAS